MDRIITHSCGHQEHHFVPGYWACDRDHNAARLAWRKCTSCRAEGRRTAVVRDQLAAGERLGAIDLPPLSGSLRQIAWAETIRRQHLAGLRLAAPGVVEQAARLRDARWWIEHRSYTAAQIAALVVVQVDLPAGAMPHGVT